MGAQGRLAAANLHGQTAAEQRRSATSGHLPFPLISLPAAVEQHQAHPDPA